LHNTVLVLPLLAVNGIGVPVVPLIDGMIMVTACYLLGFLISKLIVCMIVA